VGQRPEPAVEARRWQPDQVEPGHHHQHQSRFPPWGIVEQETEHEQLGDHHVADEDHDVRPAVHDEREDERHVDADGEPPPAEPVPDLLGPRTSQKQEGREPVGEVGEDDVEVALAAQRVGEQPRQRAPVVERVDVLHRLRDGDQEPRHYETDDEGHGGQRQRAGRRAQPFAADPDDGLGEKRHEHPFLHEEAGCAQHEAGVVPPLEDQPEGQDDERIGVQVDHPDEEQVPFEVAVVEADGHHRDERRRRRRALGPREGEARQQEHDAPDVRRHLEGPPRVSMEGPRE
jgi:hypothetical protein